MIPEDWLQKLFIYENVSKEVKQENFVVGLKDMWKIKLNKQKIKFDTHINPPAYIAYTSVQTFFFPLNNQYWLIVSRDYRFIFFVVNLNRVRKQFIIASIMNNFKIFFFRKFNTKINQLS